MSRAETEKEKKIISMFGEGNPLAMDMLYAQYSRYLAGVCSRYIANDDDLKDVLQESFVKIFMRIGSFDYRGEGSLKAWLSRIVVNEALQHLRRGQKNVFEDAAELPDMPDEEPDTNGIDSKTLVEMIRRLPPGYRAVVNLYVFGEKSHKEIAEILGIKPDSSASQFHKAKKMLAGMINEYKRSRQ